MTMSDKINLTLCILSFLLAAMSIVIVVLTIRQNNKMIESSTRPYLMVYDNFTYFQDVKYYLILKNFGQSSAIIQKFDYDIDLTDCVVFRDARAPFTNMVGTSVSPGQSFISEIDIVKALQKTDTILFHVEYLSSSKKVYKEEISLNLKARTDSLISKATTNNKELKIISYAMQELVEKQL